MRRSHWLLGVVLLSGLAGLVYYLRLPPPPSEWDRAMALRPGATRADVQAAIGGPPGDYRHDPDAGVPLPMPTVRAGAEMWSTDGGMVYVWFDGDDRVTEVYGYPGVVRRPPVYQRVLRAVGFR